MMKNKTISPITLVSTARQVTRANNPTAYRLGRIFFNRGMLPLFCLGYAYFRWLDDLIDQPNGSSHLVKSIVSRQKQLIAKTYEIETQPVSPPLNVYEQMVITLIQHDLANGCYFRIYLDDMFSTLEFDAERRYKLCPQKSLDRYSHRLGQAYTTVLQICTASPGNSTPPCEKAGIAGYAAHQAHILRDFYLDISLGYYNISQEDLDKFNWSLAELTSARTEKLDIRSWVERRTSTAYDAVEQGVKAIKKIKNWRCRFLGYATTAHYMYILEKIKQNGYRLQPTYDPSSVEKLRMLAWALKLSLPDSDTAVSTKNTQIVEPKSP